MTAKIETRLLDANELIQIAEQQGHLTVDDILCADTIDPETLRPKGHWNIRCDYYDDDMTREADESFYLECSECKRKVWDVIAHGVIFDAGLLARYINTGLTPEEVEELKFRMDELEK